MHKDFSLMHILKEIYGKDLAGFRTPPRISGGFYRNLPGLITEEVLRFSTRASFPSFNSFFKMAAGVSPHTHSPKTHPEKLPEPAVADPQIP
jgi:hypothetical protein